MLRYGPDGERKKKVLWIQSGRWCLVGYILILQHRGILQLWPAGEDPWCWESLELVGEDEMNTAEHEPP